jgi:hypothetical protein
MVTLTLVAKRAIPPNRTGAQLSGLPGSGIPEGPGDRFHMATLPPLCPQLRKFLTTRQGRVDAQLA